MRTLTFAEWRKWQLFDAETPIDDLRTHHLPAATVAAVIANGNRNPQKKREPFTADDFLPPWKELGEVGVPISNDDMVAKLQMVAEHVNS